MSVTTKMLREGGSTVSQETVDKVAEKFGPGFTVTYDEKGRIFFPEEAIGGTIRQPFGSGDKEKAWKLHENQLIRDLGHVPGKEAFDWAKEKYEMHHSNEDGVFELVDRNVHKAYAHTGGYALSKQDQSAPHESGGYAAVAPEPEGSMKRQLPKSKKAAEPARRRRKKDAG